MDSSPPRSSVHGILRARTLEWVSMPSSRGSSWPRGRTCVSCVSSIAGRFFTVEPPGKPHGRCSVKINSVNFRNSTLGWESNRHMAIHLMQWFLMGAMHGIYRIQIAGECIQNQRRLWQPTPVLLPGKSHGRRSLVGCSPWGREESDMTEET